MREDELYKELGKLTRDRAKWEESVPYVSSLLAHESVKIRAKALWLLGEIGLAHPPAARGEVPAVASFLDSPVPLLRERAVNALGRIGRGDFHGIERYWAELFRFASDGEPGVRLSFVWASENIAANTPGVYEGHMPVFEGLLRDADDRVRMEAPEFFRVMGKRRPELVRPYAEELRQISETDGNHVVRIHCLGAIKAMETARREKNAGGGGMRIRKVENKRDYLPLLLLADEQEDMIDLYLDRGTMYVLEDGGAALGECVVTDEGDGVLEIQNLAVAQAHQGKGYGKKLIEYVIERYKGRYAVLQVGTGDSPLTVPFYERCGFVRHHVLKNYILDHYDRPIFEGGVRLTDKVYLRMDL